MHMGKSDCWTCVGKVYSCWKVDEAGGVEEERLITVAAPDGWSAANGPPSEWSAGVLVKTGCWTEWSTGALVKNYEQNCHDHSSTFASFFVRSKCLIFLLGHLTEHVQQRLHKFNFWPEFVRWPDVNKSTAYRTFTVREWLGLGLTWDGGRGEVRTWRNDGCLLYVLYYASLFMRCQRVQISYVYTCISVMGRRKGEVGGAWRNNGCLLYVLYSSLFSRCQRVTLDGLNIRCSNLVCLHMCFSHGAEGGEK